jgi:hypothetical protein
MSRSTFTLLAAVAVWLSSLETAVAQSSRSSDSQSQALSATTDESRTPSTARGFRMGNDGVVEGRIHMIAGDSLDLVPIPYAHITFMRNRRFVAQGRTNAEGRFAIRGLTAWSVYSVFISSTKSIAALSAPVIPDTAGQGAANSSGSRATMAVLPRINQFRILPATRNTNGDDPYIDVQALPREDFIVALQSGLFDNGAGAGGGGAGAGAGAGNGGGGGGGGGGLDGAALGLAAAVAIGFAAAQNDDELPLASPFEPTLTPEQFGATGGGELFPAGSGVITD